MLQTANTFLKWLHGIEKGEGSSSGVTSCFIGALESHGCLQVKPCTKMLALSWKNDASDITSVLAKFLDDMFEFCEHFPGNGVEFLWFVDSDECNLAVFEECGLNIRYHLN